MKNQIKFIGDSQVPEEAREEFVDAVLQILREGGIVQREHVYAYGRQVLLGHPPELTQEGQKITFEYSCLEGQTWEPACFNTGRCSFEAGEIGDGPFSKVVRAVYLLYEFYPPGFLCVDKRIADERKGIGWLNQVLDADFENSRLQDPWFILTSLQQELRNISDLRPILASDPSVPPSLLGYLKYSYVAHPDKFPYILGLIKECKLKNGEPFFDLSALSLALCSRLRELKSAASPRREKLAFLEEVAVSGGGASEPQRRRTNSRVSEDYKSIAALAALMPSEYFLILVARVFNVDFWQLWQRAAPQMKDRDGIWAMEPPPCPPVPAVSTSEYLCCDDDDRAFFWTRTNDVFFSDEMQQWLEELCLEYEEILAQREQSIPARDFPQVFVETLNAANRVDKRIFCWRDMYHDFLAHPRSKKVQASVVLLQQVIERYARKEPFRIQRYLSVLANRKLRKELFRFSF